MISKILQTFFSLIVFLSVFCINCHLSGQVSSPPISELQRKFIRLEQRAIKLSEQIADATGTEPIQLIDRNESLNPVEIESSAQQSYDSLPGPTVTPLVLPEKEPEEPKPTVFQSEVNRVVATTQQRKGDYYIMPIIGFAAATRTSYTPDQLDDELDGEWGNSIGLTLGKRWDNWMAYTRIGYQYLQYSNNDFVGNGLDTQVEGTEESYSISIGGGYAVPITESLSTYGLSGIGFAWRRNSADVKELLLGNWQINPDFPSSESSLVFTYEFSLGFEYMFKNNFSAILGYRLLGLTSNKSFEGSFQHLIELGVGANF